MKPELNKLAVWRPILTKGLSVRSFNEYPYKEKGTFRVSNVPVYRYAKNYSQGKKEYSLLMVSKDDNAKKVETFMDKSAKEILSDDITGKLKLTGVYYS